MVSSILRVAEEWLCAKKGEAEVCAGVVCGRKRARPAFCQHAPGRCERSCAFPPTCRQQPPPPGLLLAWKGPAQLGRPRGECAGRKSPRKKVCPPPCGGKAGGERGGCWGTWRRAQAPSRAATSPGPSTRSERSLHLTLARPSLFQGLFLPNPLQARFLSRCRKSAFC